MTREQMYRVRKFNVDQTNAHRYLPTGLALKVRHLHPGNSTDEERRVLTSTVGAGKPPRFVTLARVVSRANGVTLASGIAACSPKDAPRHSIGHHIAAGRAVSQYYENYARA